MSSPPQQPPQYQDEDGPHDSTGLLVKSPRSMYRDYSQSAAARQRPELPSLSIDDPLYSSTVTMLKRTRAEVEAYSSDLSAVASIVELPTSEAVRKTVAKMFAEPQNAAVISEAEWRRREREYQQNRDKFSEQMTTTIKKEKEVMGKELARLSDD